MKRLYVYILKKFFGPLIATFFVSIFVLFMQFLWLYVDDLVGKGLDTMVVLEFVFQAILTLLPRSVPLAVLLASLMTFGNMGEKLELLSIKAAGVSLFRAMTPVIILVTFVSVAMLYFNNDVYPEAFRKMRVLIYDIKRAKPELSFKNEVFNTDIPGLTVRIGKKDIKTGMLHNVMIYDQRDNNEPTVTRADSGLMKTTDDKRHLILTLFDGKTYGEVRQEKNKRSKNDDFAQPFRRDTFQKQTVLFEIDENFKKSNEDAAKNQYFSKNYKQLAESYDSLVTLENKRAELFYLSKIKFAYHKKLPESRTKNVINPVQRNTNYDLDSLFVMMNKREQESTINFALQSARKVKNNIMERDREEENIMYNTRRHLFELNNRIALALLSLIMFFIGAPLGAIVRKGGLGLPVVLSVFFFVLYYIIDNFGRHLTYNAGHSAYVGAWLSTMVLLPIGIFLTRQATSDSVIMNVENYYLFFKKIFKKNKNERG
ncbi:LptF/LptG family permease [Saccharicrinis sp. FJH2]|uniref:LptF/LptG family permease n=1 Tax=Saccharicrinis sp. FJH65 TaxID=3344659 RepID=UPI0035F3B130